MGVAQSEEFVSPDREIRGMLEKVDKYLPKTRDNLGF